MLIHPGAEPDSDAEKVVVGFLEDWGPGAWPHMRECYSRWLTDDVSWENTASPPTVGKAAVMDLLTLRHDALEMEYCTTELRSLASRGDVVLTERVDRVHVRDGSVAMAIPIMGTFHVRERKIARCADYHADSLAPERFPRHRDEADTDESCRPGPESVERAVRRLVAVEEIKRLKARYFRCVDGKQWDEFRTLFTDDFQADFAESTSGARGPEDFVAAAARHFAGAVSIHHGHAPEIEILSEETATGRWPMFDLVQTPADSDYESHTGYGHYTEEYRRVNGQWRIRRSRLTRVTRTVLPNA